MDNYRMWIDGKWVSAVSGETYTVVNPATEEEIALVPKGDERDIDLAVKAARKAFPLWSGKSQAERTAIVTRISEMIIEKEEELARIEVLDHGTPWNLALFCVYNMANYMEYNARAGRDMMNHTLPNNPDNLYYYKREPLGVCALITPWNVPLIMLGMKLGAALSVGNTCVVKPPSIDSLATLKFAEILEKAGLPEGAVNIVTGPGGSAGQALAGHPDVDLVSFTGSSETGKQIMAAGSRTMKRMVLELGGKNPFIILDDADLGMAVQKAIMGSYLNSGMVCASPGRYYISEKVYHEFIERFLAAAREITVGDPMDQSISMGPLVSAEHRDRVEKFIQSGLDEGAKLVLGGRRPAEPPLNKGYYVMPTVFTGVTNDMTIAREEIFGPVACMMKFSSEDEVISLANDNNLGLCASVWTRNIAKATRMANRLQAGTVWINDHMDMPPDKPWGGYKESGIGKENSVIGLEGYTSLKVVNINMTGMK